MQIPVAFVDFVSRRSQLAAPAYNRMTQDFQFTAKTARDELKTAREILYSRPYQAWLVDITELFDAMTPGPGREMLCKWAKVFYLSPLFREDDDSHGPLSFLFLFRLEESMRDIVAKAEQIEPQPGEGALEILKIVAKAIWNSRRKRFFVTEKGRIGWLYHEVDVGDHTCYIPGAMLSASCLLRATNTSAMPVLTVCRETHYWTSYRKTAK